MQETNILNDLQEQAHSIKEEDIEQWLPDLLRSFEDKIQQSAQYVYGRDVSSIGVRAFREKTAEELRKGLRTYLFTSQHWRTGRDVNSYLIKCISRLASRTKNDVDGTKKNSVPICPACKSVGQREFLIYDGTLLRCDHCYSEAERLELDLVKEDIKDYLRARLRLHRIFSLHSRKGYRCPDCERFIPESYLQRYGVTCPYPDCCFFGTTSELESMSHPMGLNDFVTSSLNSSPRFDNGDGAGSQSTNSAFQDFLHSTDINADIKLEVTQNCEKELSVLNEVIDAQIEQVIRNEGEKRSIQKLLMYEAYKNLVKSYPDDMIAYLVHQKHFSGLPIQSRIFQEYVRLIENALPFTITRSNKNYEICSLMDQNLHLFLGLSEFESVVKSDRTIANNTIETYTGSRKLKFFGPCFIGLLVDVSNRETGQSLLSLVENYTFMQIILSNKVQTGTSVNVKHFRIPSHYEMGALVYLQRIRRKLVDSIYFKLHGKKREIGLDGKNKRSS